MQETTAATFCATLVDEWVRCGVRHAVVAPGSRSTPLALALAEHAAVAIDVVLDERAAAFVALGVGRSTGGPAVVLCSSGTAGTHFHGAVVEADLSGVPMLVCTADRPPELQGVHAPQTIDQRGLYGRAVRAELHPGVPDPAASGSWRTLAAASFASATGHPPGPVHLNLAFRDPLVGRAGALPTARSHADAPGAAPAGALPLHRLDGRRGVIVAGEGVEDPEGVRLLSERTGWPVLADHRSSARRRPNGIAHFDPILRVAHVADELAPDVVLGLGGAPASKVLSQWLSEHRVERVVVDRHGRRRDPEHLASNVVTAEPGSACRTAAAGWTAPRSSDLERWRRLDDRAADAIEVALEGEDGLSGPAVARIVSSTVAVGGHLVVASSMPVRDLEWFAPARDEIVVHANRGANGIDGVISTAIGVAVGSGSPTTVMLGDLAFLHDSTALVRLLDRGLELRIVVVDNDGGGIFSFLPQASELDEARFEALFGTPHRACLADLAVAHGLSAVTVGAPSDLRATLADRSGPVVVVARTDRVGDVGLHDRLHAAVAAAIASGSDDPAE